MRKVSAVGSEESALQRYAYRITILTHPVITKTGDWRYVRNRVVGDDKE
jgi:hypothetical protein